MDQTNDFLKQTIIFSLLVVEKIIKLLEKTYKGDLTFNEFYALLSVGSFESITMTDFACNLGIKKQQATRIINKLVEKNFIKRTYYESDRRIILISLTSEAKAYLKEYSEKTSLIIEGSLEGFSESELEEFQKAIETINRMLPKMDV